VDFMMPDGALYINGAEKIIPNINSFMEHMTLENGYMGVIFTEDTHKEETYIGSLEETGDEEHGIPGFPPHCYEGTEGFNFAVDPTKAVKTTNFRRFILNKGVFDMWEENDLVVRPLVLAGEPLAYGGAQDRDEFFESLILTGVTHIDVLGCATDYCVKYAIAGLLTRGYTVTVYDNMVAGIERDIHQVAADEFSYYVDQGKLIIG